MIVAAIIDRKARDELSDLLVKFMTGRIKSFAFSNATFDITSKDKTVDRVVGQLWYFYDDLIDHTIGVSPDQWDCLKYWLAFLQTDDHLAIIRMPYGHRHRRIVAGVYLAILAVTAVISWFTTAWISLYVAWPLLGLSWAFFPQVDPEQIRTIESMYPYAPFLSPADWQAQEHLLDRFSLPEYRSEVHGKPYRSQPISLMHVKFATIIFLPIVLISALWPCCEKIYLRAPATPAQPLKGTRGEEPTSGPKDWKNDSSPGRLNYVIRSDPNVGAVSGNSRCG